MTRFSIILVLSVFSSTTVAADPGDLRPGSPDDCSAAKTAFGRIKATAKHIEDPGHPLTDVRHYVVDFEVDPVARTFDGSTTMTVASRISGLTTFRFWLSEPMVISSVEIDGHTAQWQRFDATRVDVTLDRAYDDGEVFDLEVSYIGTPAPGWMFSEQGGSPIVSTLSEPWNANEWWAVKNDNTDKATGEFLVTVPSDLIVVSNGDFVSTQVVDGNRTRFHWSTQYQTTPYLFAFSTTVYNTFSETYFFDGGSMPVEFFIYPDSDSTENRNGWRLSLDMMSTFEELFGPYPFRNEKYAIYQFPFGGGMEHQTASGQGGTHTFGEPLTAHELAHQWWGDMVTCATWHDIWLNEGFATYSTALWYEYASGTPNDEARSVFMEIRRPSELDGTVYVYDVSDSSRIFSSNYSYSKGAWVVHMLRGVLGDEDFFDTLAAYRNRYEYSAATTDDLKRVAEGVSGEYLGWFFDEWVYGGGAPGYSYGWQEQVINGQRYLELVLEQTQDEAVFQMPVEIVTNEGGENRSYTIWNDARIEHHLIPVAGDVGDVELDPDDWILVRAKEAIPFVDGPPKIVAIDPPPRAVHSMGQQLSVDITFHRDVVVGEGDIILRRRGGREYDLDVSYHPATSMATVTTNEILPGGWYEIVVLDEIVDAEDGIALDGEFEVVRSSLLPSGDGVPGGDAVIDFGVIGLRQSTGGRVVPGPRTKTIF